MDKRELRTRTKFLVLRLLKLVDALPRTAAGRAISNQEANELTAILAAGRKSAASNRTSDI